MSLHTTTFTGGNKELKSHYYDSSSYKQTEKYITTTKAIKKYVGKKYSNGTYIRVTLDNIQELQIENLTDPTMAYNNIVNPDSGKLNRQLLSKCPIWRHVL